MGEGGAAVSLGLPSRTALAGGLVDGVESLHAGGMAFFS